MDSLKFEQSWRTISLSMAIGTVGILIFSIQPVILGALFTEKILDAVDLGRTATSEVFFAAAGIVAGTRWLKSLRTRWIPILAGSLLVMANIATSLVIEPWQIIGLRTIAGFCEGILTAIVILTIAFSKMPGRINAAFLTVSAVPGAMGAYWLSNGPGSGDGFLMLAATAAVATVAVAGIQQDFAPSVVGDDAVHGKSWSLPVILALFGSLLTASRVGCFWAYLEPLALRNGLPDHAAGTAVTVSVVTSVIASLFVTIWGWRMPPIPVLVVGAMTQMGVVIMIAGTTVPFTLYVLLGVFGMVWQGTAPFAMDLVASLDRSRTTAPYVYPLSIVGMSTGPLIASFVADENLSSVVTVAMCLFTAAAALYAALGLMMRRSFPAIRADHAG